MEILIERIGEDLKQALKEGDEIKVSTLRFLISKINNSKIAKGKDLTDEEIIGEIAKEVKRHQESIEAYKKGNRADLVDKEGKELAILKGYLPEPLTDEELETMVDEAISLLDAKSPNDSGRVIKAVLSSASIRADGAKVAQIVKKKLAVA